MTDQGSLLKILRASPFPTLILLPDDPQYTIVDANDVFLEQTHNCIKKIKGKSIFMLSCIRPHQIQALLAKLLKTGAPQQVWASDKLLSELIPVFSHAGTIEYIIYTVTDILNLTNPPAVKNHAGSLPRVYEDVLRLTPVPAMIFDGETFEILDANEMALQLYGYQSNEFLQMKLNDLWKQDVPDLHELHHRRS